MSELVERMAGLEAEHKAHVRSTDERFKTFNRRLDDEVAPRYWVREELQTAMKPLVEAQTKMAATQERTAEQIEELTATQNEAMRQRMTNEKAESEAKIASLQAASFQNVIKKWWFWLLAGLAFLPQLVAAIEAFKKLFQ